MNAALAYAASKHKYRADVINVTADPGMGIKFKIFGFDLGTPTWWEAYYNISGWVVELFSDASPQHPTINLAAL